MRSLSTYCSLVAAALVMAGCAERASTYDYAAFLQAKPASLVVMPPLNNSPDVKATAAVWAHATRPLAEAGYYVLPAGLVDEMFRQNGVHSAHDAAGIPYQKLHEVFGADAAVYIDIRRYGTDYAVINSQTRVEVAARIVDLRSGARLWDGQAWSTSSGPTSSSGLVGLLVSAFVNQVVDSVADKSFEVADSADQRLLGPGHVDGILPGPRFPKPVGKTAE